MDEAVEFLRKNGQAKAEKKASRIAAEGLCTVVVKDDTTAAVVEVNSETDFVAKNETFQSFVKAVAAQAVNSDAKIWMHSWLRHGTRMLLRLLMMH